MSDTYIMNEVCIPGLSESGICDLSQKKVCPKCGKTVDKCTCKKK